MKTFILSTLIAFASIVGATASHRPDSKSSSTHIIRVTNTAYKLYFTEQKQGIIYVRISDKNDNIIIRDYIKNTNGFVRTYNMENLKPGNYKIEVMKRGEVLASEFVPVHDQNFEIQTISPKKYMLTIDKWNPGNVEICVFSRSNELICRDHFRYGGELTKLYDFSDRNDKKYTFQVHSLNKERKEHIQSYKIR